MTACGEQSGSSVSEPEQTTSAAEKPEQTTSAAEKPSKVEFRLDKISAAGDDVFYSSDYVKEVLRSTDGGDWQKFVLGPSSSSSVFADADKVYYVSSNELHQINYDGTSDYALCRCDNDSGYYHETNYLQMEGDKLIYYNMEDCLTEYDIKTESKKLLFEDSMRNCFAAQSKIYYFFTIGYEATPCCYDLNTGKKTELTDSFIYDFKYINDNWICDGEDIYFAVEKDGKKSSDIYKLNVADGTAEKACTVSVEKDLYITTVKNGTVFYQDKITDDGEFKTYKMALSGGEPDLIENIDFYLYDDGLKDKACFNVDGTHLYYDFEQEAFKRIDVGEKEYDLNYLIDKYCYYHGSDGDKVSKYSFDDELPRLEDLKKHDSYYIFSHVEPEYVHY